MDINHHLMNFLLFHRYGDSLNIIFFQSKGLLHVFTVKKGLIEELFPEKFRQFLRDKLNSTTYSDLLRRSHKTSLNFLTLFEVLKESRKINALFIGFCIKLNYYGIFAELHFSKKVFPLVFFLLNIFTINFLLTLQRNLKLTHLFDHCVILYSNFFPL